MKIEKEKPTLCAMAWINFQQFLLSKNVKKATPGISRIITNKSFNHPQIKSRVGLRRSYLLSLSLSRRVFWPLLHVTVGMQARKGRCSKSGWIGIFPTQSIDSSSTRPTSSRVELMTGSLPSLTDMTGRDSLTQIEATGAKLPVSRFRI